MAQLILKRAAASRPSGEWNDDDYDVLADSPILDGTHLTSASVTVGGVTHRWADLGDAAFGADSAIAWVKPLL